MPPVSAATFREAIVTDSAKQLPTVYAAKVTGHSVSQEGTLGLLEFETPDGGRVAVAFPVSQMSAVSDQITELFYTLRRRNVGGNSILRYPTTFGVTTNAAIRGAVLVGFDPETPKEINFVLRNYEFAANLARQIADNAKKVMTPDDKAKETRGRIILPGQR